MPSVPVVIQRERKPQRPGLLREIAGLVLSRIKSPVGVSDMSWWPAGSGGWWPVIREPFTGAWQRNMETRSESVMAHYAVYSCITLIASDISKMCLRLMEQDKATGIWEEATSPAFSPVLRKPNRYQTRIKFIENWVVSKLARGNTIVLKQRDERRVVTGLYILDWGRVKPLVAPDGAVFYQLSADNLAGIGEQVVVPASEIIHDTMVPLFHPLCGVSPLFACGLAAMQGITIQNNSVSFFSNGATPSGILTAPGEISDPDAERFKKEWEVKFSGQNAGRVAVLGGGLKYEKMTMSAEESQMIEQLKWSAETVCSCFHLPAYMIGVGTPPAYNNIEALNQQYYSQCLQAIIESIELLLDEGLGLTEMQGKVYGTEFDLDDLLRMDSKTMAETEKQLQGVKAPNESRKRFNLKPLPGGNSVYLQEQNFSLEALAKRDAQDDPFASKSPAAPASPAAAAASDEPPADELDQAAKNQIAAWAFKEALDGELQKMVA